MSEIRNGPGFRWSGAGGAVLLVGQAVVSGFLEASPHLRWRGYRSLGLKPSNDFSFFHGLQNPGSARELPGPSCG